MRYLLLLIGLMAPLLASAQASRYGDVSYSQPQDCSVITRDQRANPYAHLFRNMCAQSDARTKQNIARIMGRPQPSTRVLRVPAYGTDEAKRYGVACMGGLVMLVCPTAGSRRSMRSIAISRAAADPRRKAVEALESDTGRLDSAGGPRPFARGVGA